MIPISLVTSTTSHLTTHNGTDTSSCLRVSVSYLNYLIKKCGLMALRTTNQRISPIHHKRSDYNL